MSRQPLGRGMSVDGLLECVNSGDRVAFEAYLPSSAQSSPSELLARVQSGWTPQQFLCSPLEISMESALRSCSWADSGPILVQNWLVDGPNPLSDGEN